MVKLQKYTHCQYNLPFICRAYQSLCFLTALKNAIIKYHEKLGMRWFEGGN